jgi:GntR family transcriptional regulator
MRTAVASGRTVEACDTVMDASAFVLHYSLPAQLPDAEATD